MNPSNRISSDNIVSAYQEEIREEPVCSASDDDSTAASNSFKKPEILPEILVPLKLTTQFPRVERDLLETVDLTSLNNIVNLATGEKIFVKFSYRSIFYSE